MMTISDALELTQEDNIINHKEYINPGLVKMLKLINSDKRYVRAKGCVVTDEEGNEYLDFLGGYGVLSLGHNHEEIIEEMMKVVELPNILQIHLNPVTGALAKNLAMLTPGDLKMSFFASSGAEAVESAIKLARKATKKTRIISCKGGYHGKTLGALSVSGREHYKVHFEPLLPDVELITYGDESELKRALEHQKAAAFIVEPIQGENGIMVPPEGYLHEVREICSRHHTLLIFDEVQTGLGKTGDLFACNHENVTPDILCLSKALGGGIMPLSACVATEKVWKKAYGKMDDCTLHTSTFGGNTWSAAAGIVTLNILVESGLISEAKEKGSYIMEKLRSLVSDSPILKEVRGRGLMIGIEFDDSDHRLMSKLSNEYLGGLIAGELLNKYRILTAYTLHNPNVIRLEPPLSISYEQLDQFYEAIEAIVHDYRSFAGIAKSTISTKIKK